MVVWGGQAADRCIQVLAGAPRPIGPIAEIVVVDDDLGGPYPSPSRQTFFDALATERRDPRHVDAPTSDSKGALVVALFGDIRSWKGRPGYSKEAEDAVAAACEAARRQARDAIVVQFSHPRLAPQIRGATSIVCAWGGEPVMQAAAARWLARNC